MTFRVDILNHYEANSEFRLLYSDITDHFYELEAFLKHIHDFVVSAESKLNKDLQLYSEDFFEYYYARSYGETFRSSFIVTVSSVSEVYIKYYVETWKKLLKTDFENLKPTNGILDYLKTADKKFLNLEIDFATKAVEEFRGLLAVRNSMVHSSGNLDYVQKYEPIIRQLAKVYSSLHVSDDGYIWTEESFCKECMTISKKFFFYIFKLALRKFPKYRIDKPEDGFI
jgi:hypothetical protein